jgi:D-alanyl-D-alanine carboxypeptidase (penicillin-binding protein 5/6)
MRTTAYKFPGVGKTLTKKRARFEIQSHNRLLRNLPGATGVKNGYTIAARGSFIGTASRDGHSYIAVLMRAEGSTWHATADLLEWAFANGDRARGVGTLIRPGELAAPIGPAFGDHGNSLGAAAGTASGEPPGTDNQAGLRGALPAAQASLTKSASSGTVRLVGLAAAALGLLTIAFIAGRRPLQGGRRPLPRLAARPKSGPRAQAPGGGRHRT